MSLLTRTGRSATGSSQLRRWAAIWLIGCGLLGCGKYSEAFIHPSPGDRAILLIDSPEVRKLIAVESERQSAVKHRDKRLSAWEADASARQASIQGILKMDHTEVARGTRVSVIEPTICRCSLSSRFSSEAYVKIVILDGPLRGKVGWMCETTIGRYAAIP